MEISIFLATKLVKRNVEYLIIYLFASIHHPKQLSRLKNLSHYKGMLLWNIFNIEAISIYVFSTTGKMKFTDFNTRENNWFILYIVYIKQGHMTRYIGEFSISVVLPIHKLVKLQIKTLQNSWPINLPILHKTWTTLIKAKSNLVFSSAWSYVRYQVEKEKRNGQVFVPAGASSRC